MLKLSCPRCKKEQNYDPRGSSPVGKSKRCVYCGYTFKVHQNIWESRIV